MANDKHSQHLPDGEHFDVVTTTTSKNDSNITLVWVDEEAMNLASPKYRVTIDMLQKICGNNYKLYDCVDLFLMEVEGMTKTMKIIVVMSGLFASSILPKLSASLLRELSSIFIFCKEYDDYKYLLKKCRKIIAICSDDHSLKTAIENELQSPTDFVIMNQNLIPIFSLKEEYQDFLWYKLHIEVLTHYPWSRDNTQKMLSKCNQYYWKDNVQKKNIEQFKNTYKPENAIEWYTRDSFVYRLVNKALRSLDMEEINIFQPYIKALCRQLEQLHKQNQSNKPLTVFRGHGNMTTSQLDKIKENINALVSFNGFLSTSTNYNVAVMFAGTTSTNEESVIFEIKTNYNLTNVIFADISQFSNMPVEDEVLFSLCSVFKIDSAVRDEENQLWKIVMSASDEDTLNLSDYFNKKAMEKHQATELHRYPDIIHGADDKIKQKIDNEIGISMSNKQETNRVLRWINRYLSRRTIVITFITFFCIIAAIVGVVCGLFIKSTQPVSNSDNCESINCTTFNTATVTYGVTVAGGHGPGNATNQLNSPFGIFVDDNQTIIIADWDNDRIMQWRVNDTDGQVVAGGHGEGNRLDQLKGPSDVLIDKETNSLIICDRWNRRVVRWSRQYGTTEGELLLDDIFCSGLFMDDQKYLYVSDTEKDEIRQYQIGDKNGTVVAGGHGNGDGLNQLSNPYYFFVDQQQNVYVSDTGNHRVMKWNKDAKEGLVVITSEATGDAIWQLGIPEGLFVDTLGILYVVDERNDRVMRWSNTTTRGTVIAGGNGQGEEANQFNTPDDLFFDGYGNFYVVDSANNRVLRFSID
ncbi:unnamed protein product [Adineta steineri]|uniref:NAD(P)(+)--arginine ADP-ribosyltransferase n=2 Tax=Adineta steineri TaxID=433720 RepID=A0A813UYX7_9BILA|nr:unnamed protein product [Adineta steineri]